MVAAFAASDLVALVAAIAAGYLVAAIVNDGDTGGMRAPHLALYAATLPGWLAVLGHYGLYTTRFVRSRIEEFRRLCHAIGASTLGTAMAAYMLRLDVARSWLIASCAFAIVSVTIEREVRRFIVAAMRRRGRLLRPVVVVGGNAEGRALWTMLNDDPTLGYRVVGFIDDVVRAHDHSGAPVPDTTRETLEEVARTGAAAVVIATTSVDFQTSNRLARELTEAGVHVEVSLALRDIVPERLTVRPLGRFPVVYVEPTVRNGWRAGAKRGLDLAVATTGLVLSLPLLIAVMIAIKLDSKGPVLFRQTRIGRNARPFDVLKFRTMVPGAESMVIELRDRNEAGGPLFKLAEDPRVTRVGRWLRRTSIDELPQLWNVLRGEMSLVGPRPALASEMADWEPELHSRLRVKPGITGMWQVHRGHDWSFDDYVRHDLHYVDNWSLLTDVAIGLKTIPALLFGRTANR